MTFNTKKPIATITAAILLSSIAIFGAQIQIANAQASFLFEFGTFGTGPSQFLNMLDVVVDSNDRIIVIDADDGNGVIEVYDSAGVFQFQFGTFGIGPGEVQSPEAIAVDSFDNIHLADADRGKIIVYDSTGAFQYEFGTFGTGLGEFGFITDVAVDSSDFVYVSDEENSKILVFTDTGIFDFEFGTFGTGPGEFLNPIALEMDNFERINLVDQDTNRIIVFDNAGNFLFEFGSLGTGPGEFDGVVDVAIDSLDNIIIADSFNNRIQVFDSTGVFQYEFGIFGTGDGEFNEPFSVGVNSGTDILVADIGNSRIQVFEQSSAPVSPDTDGDGILNEIDLQPTVFSDVFDDIVLGGTTFGQILDRGNQVLRISEIPNPDGVEVNTASPGGALPGVISFCGGLSVIQFSPGDEAIVTCTSVRIDVISGDLEVSFFATDGTEATTIITQGNSITFDQDTFSFVTPPTNTQAIIIIVEGKQITVNPGDTNTSEPVVGTIITSQEPVQLGTLVETSASFTDLGPLETHTAEWDWGDQTTSSGIVSENGLSGTVTGSHTYSTTGVYTVTLTVTDNSGDSGTSIFQFVVIYDPNGGFVTGGGWIDSPLGAYVSEPSLVGKATFGFVSKYQNGANTPTGNTQFSFKVADLKFKSSEYDWLVVAGSNAQFKGTGTIDGQGNYGFLLFGFDADLNTNDSFVDDKFRIKIWDKDNGDAVVYDNNLNQPESAQPSTILGGGSIVIHNP